MRGGEQNSQRGYEGEGDTDPQTQAVDHHGSESPLPADHHLLLLPFTPGGDLPDLPQDTQ